MGTMLPLKKEGDKKVKSRSKIQVIGWAKIYIYTKKFFFCVRYSNGIENGMYRWLKSGNLLDSPTSNDPNQLHINYPLHF